VVIPKDEGVPKLHRLRPLHLVEPEINALAKALWSRKLMKIANQEKIMTDDQYGGRKNRQAQSAILNKVLYYDINRMSMCECQYDDIDMKSNYDRELARLVTAEASIKLGMHRNDANFMVDFVENQEYYIKTAFGTTENHYKYTENEKLYGLGQGIAWAGPGWLISSDTIATCKKSTCSGMIFKSPISDLEVKKLQDMFVDDTACGCNTASKKECTIMEQAQENCQKHSDYVEVTGGLVAADKSHYYHVDWKFVNGLQVPIIDTDQRSQIFLHQGDGICREIKKMPITQEHKTLGCWVNPLGKKEKAFQQMTQFAKKWRNRMLNSGLAPHLIRQSYETELKSQLRYRLPIYQFTENECDHLMKIISPVMLNAFYANKKYPRSLMQANDQYAGMGIEHLYDTMGMEKSKFMFMHLRRMDTTGKLLIIAMQQAQLECGSGTLFFNLDFEEWNKLITQTWQTNLWEYYSKRRMMIDLDLEIVTKHNRNKDAFIMDILKQSNAFSDVELSQVNKVRQHMKLLTLSDVTDVRGNRILHNIRNCVNYRKSKYDFAPQNPLQDWKKLWKERACPILNAHVNKNPLGEWTLDCHQIFECFYDSEGDVLLWKKERFRKIGPRFERIGEDPDETAPMYYDRIVDVGIDKNGKPFIVRECERNQMNNIVERNNRYPSQKYEEQWGNIDQCAPENDLREAVEAGEVIVATDGSNKNDEGAQGWLIVNKRGKILLKGRGRIAYAKEDASSLRPELAAILAAVSYLSWFVEERKIKWRKKKKVILYTDSKNSILDLEQSLFPTTKNVFENNIDMKLETKKALRNSPLQFELVHVEAHQDENVPFDELPLPAQLNCLVDEYVGGTYAESEYNDKYQIVPFLKSQICSLSLPFRRPTSHIREQLVSFANGHKAEKQLSTFWNMPPSWQCNIEWGGLRTAIRREAGILHKTKLSKLIHKQLPTMQMMKRNGFSSSAACPLCKTTVEDWNHVLRCKCNSSSIERMKKLADIKRMLISYRTEPVLQQRLLAMIKQWSGEYKSKIPEGDRRLAKLNAAFRDQQILGIENMFVGVITHKFGECQKEHDDKMRNKQRRFNQKEWNVAFIRVLLKFSSHMWTERNNYLHNISNMTMEKQMRIMAWKLKEMLNEKKWKLRAADRHILQRSKFFFRKAPTQALQGWMERVKVSMDIEFNHEQATRQNITKWITVNGNKMVEPQCHENTLTHVTPEKKKYVQIRLSEAFRKDVLDNNTLKDNNDAISDWDEIRSQWAFDEYEVESRSQSEDEKNGNWMYSNIVNDIESSKLENGIPAIIVIEKNNIDETIRSNIHNDIGSVVNIAHTCTVSPPRNEEDWCNKNQEAGRITRSNWFRLQIRKMKNATLKYGLEKKDDLTKLKDMPSKIGKMKNWYINRMEKNKEKKEKGASEEEIIFAEEEYEWEPSDDSEVERRALRKNLKKDEVEKMVQQWNDGSCIRKGTDASNNAIRVPSQGEICETTGTPDIISFEDIRCNESRDSDSEDQHSNMSLSRYMRTFQKRSSTITKILYTGDYESLDRWIEAPCGKGNMRHARWEVASDASKESCPKKRAEITCGKGTRSETVREMLELDSLFGSICSDATEASKDYVLVEEIAHEGEIEQYQAQQYQQSHIQGHHLVCNYPDTKPKQSIQRTDSFNHVREGSIQNQAMNPTKQTLENERKKMKEQNRDRSWGDGHEHQSLPMNVIQINKQHQISHQKKRNRIWRTKAKSQHLSQRKKMEGEERLTKSLPPIWIRNKKSGNENVDLIRYRHNQNKSKFSELSVRMTENDLQHGMT